MFYEITKKPRPGLSGFLYLGFLRMRGILARALMTMLTFADVNKHGVVLWTLLECILIAKFSEY